MRQNAHLKDELEGDTSVDLPSPSLCGSIFLDCEQFFNIFLTQVLFFGLKFCHLATKEKGCGDGQPRKDFNENIDQSHHIASIWQV
jgi:hypothetical protein